MNWMRCTRAMISSPGRILSLLLLAAGVGCSVVGMKSDRTPEYHDALDRWTRSARLYRGLETKLEVWAVYLSPDFRRHYVLEYSVAFGLTPQERTDMLKEEMKQAEEKEEFILAVHTTFAENNDLSAEDSTWKINLLRGGSPEMGVEVERVWFTKDFASRFYPMVDLWARTYLVSFSVPDPDSREPGVPLALEITGPSGRVEMIWKGGF